MRRESYFIFQNTEEEVKLMGVFMAQIIREGLTFEVDRSGGEYTVIELTGGY